MGLRKRFSLCRPDLPSWTELNSARIHACLISSPCFLSKSCSTLGHSVCTTDLQKTLQTVARCSNLHHNQAFMQQKRTLLIRKLKDNLSYFAHNGTIFSWSLFFFFKWVKFSSCKVQCYIHHQFQLIFKPNKVRKYMITEPLIAGINKYLTTTQKVHLHKL